MTAPAIFPVLSPLARLGDTWTSRRSGGRIHHAHDIEAPAGSPIVSPIAGRVQHVYTREHPQVGYGVIIEDADHWLHLFAHMQRPPTLRVGDAVAVGDELGVVGQTGNARSTGPHLHYGIERWFHGPRVNATARLQALLRAMRAEGGADDSADPFEPLEPSRSRRTTQPADELEVSTRTAGAGCSLGCSGHCSHSRTGRAVGEAARAHANPSSAPRAPRPAAPLPMTTPLPPLTVTDAVPDVPGGAPPTRAGERLNERGLLFVQRWSREWTLPAELAESDPTRARAWEGTMRSIFNGYGVAAAHAFVEGRTRQANELIQLAVTQHRNADRDITAAVTRLRGANLSSWLSDYLEAFGDIMHAAAREAGSVVTFGARTAADAAARIVSPLGPAVAIGVLGYLFLQSKGKRR